MDPVVKRKIILSRSETRKRLQRKTATFGRQHLQIRQEEKEGEEKPPIIREMTEEFIYKICEVIRFHEQINKVLGFVLMKNRSEVLRDSHNYLRTKLKNKYAIGMFIKLRLNLQSPKSKYAVSEKSPRMKQSIRIIKELKQRVNRLQQIIVVQSKTNRSKSVKDILLSHRKQLSRLQVSTDGDLSHYHNLENNPQQINSFRSIDNYLTNRVLSPINRPRDSIAIEQCQSHRIIEGSGRENRRSAIKLRTKFVKIR